MCSERNHRDIFVVVLTQGNDRQVPAIFYEFMVGLASAGPAVIFLEPLTEKMGEQMGVQEERVTHKYVA